MIFGLTTYPMKLAITLAVAFALAACASTETSNQSPAEKSTVARDDKIASASANPEKKPSVITQDDLDKFNNMLWTQGSVEIRGTSKLPRYIATILMAQYASRRNDSSCPQLTLTSIEPIDKPSWLTQAPENKSFVAEVWNISSCGKAARKEVSFDGQELNIDGVRSTIKKQ